MTAADRNEHPGADDERSRTLSVSAASQALDRPRGALDASLTSPPVLNDIARNHWRAANWSGLARVAATDLASHPERAQLSALCAAAELQLDNRASARELAELALTWGCAKRDLARVLLASARQALGRASIAAGRARPAIGHFEKAASVERSRTRVSDQAKLRQQSAEADLEAAVDAVAMQRKAGAHHAAARMPAWIGTLARRCTTSHDMLEAVNDALDAVITDDGDAIHFLMLIADECKARGDTLRGVHYLNTARERAANVEPELRSDLARMLVAAGQPELALDLMLDPALNGALPDDADQPLMKAMRGAYQRARVQQQARSEHGHDLLLAYLGACVGVLKSKVAGRPLRLIEIGTTRENVPGQGSTRKFAEFCQTHALQFVTVDMDPENTRVAQRMFDGMKSDSEAVTAKGEDYLRATSDPIDLVFLDAYDFDHGKHSALRQSRYERFLGGSIGERACHQMHLECAESLVEKLSDFGLVCIDDTWLEDGHWTAKGTLAVPYLLEHGFELLEARNRAALLGRAR